MDLTTLTPAQIDEAWALVAAKLRAAQEKRDSIRKVQRQVAADSETGRIYARKFEAALDAVIAADDDMQPFVAEWNRRGGWTRAYIVPGGHVHRSTHCHTLHVTTLISWLPEQSGKDEAEIVELAGERACTHCYPSAPVDVLARPTQLYTADERKDMAAKAQRAQELAAKKADAATKAITDVDGKPLRDTGNWIVKTERAAEIDAVDFLHNKLAYGYDHQDEAAFTRVVTALAHKRGTTVEEQVALVTAKAEKKAAKTAREMAR